MITPLNAALSVAAAGDNTAITGITGVNLKIWKVVITNGVATAQTVTLKDGALTSLTGAMPLATSIGAQLILGDGINPLFILTSGNAFIVNLLNATNVAGFIQYTLA